jgi:hypothetical protein
MDYDISVHEFSELITREASTYVEEWFLSGVEEQSIGKILP